MKGAIYKIVVLLVVIAAIAGIILVKNLSKKTGESSEQLSNIVRPQNQEGESRKLPQLIELGRSTCILCKKMKPILENLAIEFKGKVIVKIIHIGEEPQKTEKYKIRLIPTQIFLDAEGNEVWRHEGFLPRKDILEQFKKMGIDVSTTKAK